MGWIIGTSVAALVVGYGCGSWHTYLIMRARTDAQQAP